MYSNFLLKSRDVYVVQHTVQYLSNALHVLVFDITTAFELFFWHIVFYSPPPIQPKTSF